MEVQVTYAESCDRESCICAIHDNFIEIAEDRITSAISHDERKEQIIQLFEEELEEQGIIIDKTGTEESSN